MKAEANRVRRLNQQLDVWRSHVPSYVQEVYDRLSNQTNVNVSKDGSKLIFSSRNMTQQEYVEQEKIMNYFEKNIGKYSDFEKKITKQIEEETGEKVEYQEDVDAFIDLLSQYDSLISELFKNSDTSDLPSGYFQYAEKEKATLRERVEYLQMVIDSGIPYDPEIVEYAIINSYGFD